MMNQKKPTIEFLTYALILVISLAFRLVFLGHTPLNDFEASNALGALDLANGVKSQLPGQPGYLALTAGTFFVFSASDFFARVWPALIGALIVLIPLFFRKNIGKVPAVILATFLAIDPLLIATSRTASGGIFAVVGLLAGIGFWMNRRPILSGAAFALMFAGGADLWSGLIAIILAFIFSRVSITRGEMEGANERKADLKKAVLSALGGLVLISTLFLVKPQVISTLGASITDYLESWGVNKNPQFYQAGLAWLTSVLPGVVLGTWGVVSGLRQKNPLVKFLGYWWALALLIALLNPSRNSLELFWVSIPMWSLAAIKLHELLETNRIENNLIFLIEGTVVIALSVFSFLFLTKLVNSSATDPASIRNSVIGCLLPLALLAVVSLLLSRGWSRAAAYNGFLVGAGILLVVGMIGSSWKAAGLGNRFENEVWNGGGTPVGDSLLMGPIADLSRWSTGWKQEIDIQVTGVGSPSIKWALRNYHKTTYESVYNPNTAPSIVITGADAEIQSLASYRGQKITWSSQPDYRKMTIRDWGKWIILRKAPQVTYDVILWARNDLFLGDDS